MTVYVDDAFIETKPGQVLHHRAIWCHMTADTQEELHAFAESIGLKRGWFQNPLAKTKGIKASPGSRGAENWHYDVTKGMRAKAVRAGALQVTARELSAIITARWQTAHARHFDATQHCGGCGQPGNFCLCTASRPCRCNDRHPMGSGIGRSAAEVFSDAAPLEIEQPNLF